MVTWSPPAWLPTSKTTEVTAGTRFTYVYWSAWSMGDVVPPTTVTVTSTVPTACAGEIAVMALGESTMKLVADADPKSTWVTDENPAPLIVTRFPPAEEPTFGRTLWMTGVLT